MTLPDYYDVDPCWCLSRKAGPDGYCPECRPTDWMVCPREWCQEPLRVYDNKAICDCGLEMEI